MFVHVGGKVLFAWANNVRQAKFHRVPRGAIRIQK
jgi:hypothetical protein